MAKLKEGEIFSVKGKELDSAVLCTNSCSFVLRKAETTNLLAFCEVQNSQVSDTDTGVGKLIIRATPAFHLDLSKENTGKGALSALLKEYCIANREDFYEGKKFISWSQLQNEIPCSSEELESLLKMAMVMQKDGHWAALAESWIEEIVSLVLTSMLAEDMALDKINVEKLCSVLKDEVPPPVLKHIVVSFSDNCHHPNEKTASMSAKLICRFLAKRLLRVEDRWVKREFEMTLKNALHGLADFDPCCIEDVCIEVPGTPEPLVVKCILEELPDLPKLRFRHLFQIKRQYKHKEILPFLKHIQSPDTADRLLLKYAKSGKVQNQDGSATRVYTERA
mmetsp:Transcript_34903/g.90438  ORF Transcript_34903/g.90438 Transcript_34903/m.90438 type:complete len:336 (+) Transcript_34903:314-1321(+)